MNARLPAFSRLAGAVRRRFPWGLLALGLFGWLLPTTGAAGVDTNLVAAFEAANRLYEQGQYREAAAGYEQLLASGLETAALRFNLGNAWFKAGAPGRALFHYRLAERLAPRDPDIQANLRLLRELVHGGPVKPTPWWRQWTRRLTVNEWATLTVLSAWLCFGLLTVAEGRARIRTVCRRAALVAGGMLLLAGAGLTAQWLERRGRPEAVVITREAVVRYGPLEVSPELQKVTDGVELVVLDQKDDWYQVSLPRGLGWIRADDVVLLPP